MKSTDKDKYCSRNPLKQFLIKRFLAKITSIVLSFAPGNLLDVGCGEGFLTEYLNKSLPKIKITGVDISREVLKKAQKKIPSATFKKASIFKLPFANNSFDGVLSTELLEHLENPGKATKELLRVTKRFCILSVPNEPLFSLLRFLGGQNLWQLGRHPEHFQTWNEKSFKNFLGKIFPRVEIYKSLPWLIAIASK